MPNSPLCPVCGQPLPKALDEHELQHRLETIASPAIKRERERLERESAERLSAEKRALEQQYQQRVFNEREAARREAERALQGKILEQKNRADALAAEKQELQQSHEQQLNAERESGRRDAERAFRAQTQQLQRRAERAERERVGEIERVRRETERNLTSKVLQEKKRADALAAEKQKLEQQIATREDAARREAARLLTRDYERRLEKEQTDRNKDHKRHEIELARLETRVRDLSIALEKTRGEQLGEEAEADLFAQLNQSFKGLGDSIDRIGRGIKGADILQVVVKDGKELGRIVYESKNTADWNNNFITRAKDYQRQYDTPNVLVVSKSFPKKTRGMHIQDGIPIVEPRMAVSLAAIIRDGIGTDRKPKTKPAGTR